MPDPQLTRRSFLKRTAPLAAAALTKRNPTTRALTQQSGWKLWQSNMLPTELRLLMGARKAGSKIPRSIPGLASYLTGNKTLSFAAKATRLTRFKKVQQLLKKLSLPQGQAKPQPMSRRKFLKMAASGIAARAHNTRTAKVLRTLAK